MAVGRVPPLEHNTPVVLNMQQIPACNPALGNLQLSDDFWMYEYKVCIRLHSLMLQTASPLSPSYCSSAPGTPMPSDRPAPMGQLPLLPPGRESPSEAPLEVPGSTLPLQQGGEQQQHLEQHHHGGVWEAFPTVWQCTHGPQQRHVWLRVCC